MRSLEKYAAKKKLKKIVKELHGASKMHKSQAERLQAVSDKLKIAMMGNSNFTQRMMKGSGLAGYSKGGPVKKDGYLTDKKGKPYARVHKGERVVPKDEKTKKAWAKIAASRDPRLERAGVSGYNKPKRTPGHPTKSHIVVAKEGDRVKTIRFGQQGVKTNQTAGQRKAFKSRHGKNISKGRLSAAYWADKVKWSPSKTKDKDNQKWVKGS